MADITPQVLLTKFQKLPRLARICFLTICCNRVAPLYYAKCGQLMLHLIIPGKQPLQKVLDVLEIASKYCFNPYLYTRTDLERAKEEAGSLEGIAFGSKCSDHAFTVAFALQELMKCCINVPEAPHDDPYLGCFAHCYSLMIGCTSSVGEEKVNRQLDRDLDDFLEGMAKNGWTDESPPRGVFVRPGWSLGTPDGWPAVSAGVTFYGNAIIEGIKRAPLSLLGRLFK